MKKLTKKLSALFLLFLLLLSFNACGKKAVETGSSTEATNPPPYTTVIDGKTYTAQKLGSQDKDYQIGYFDDNNQAARFEYYMGGKLSYYYISSDFDENGNDNVQKYYNADGKLLATVDRGKFYNASGKEITESEMDALLPS